MYTSNKQYSHGVKYEIDQWFPTCYRGLDEGVDRNELLNLNWAKKKKGGGGGG